MASTGLKKKSQGKARYAWRKAHALCVYCGDRPPYEDRVACLACLKDLRLYRQRYEFKLRAMKAQGLEVIRCACRKRAMVLCIECQTALCDTCYDVGEGHCSACHLAKEDTHGPEHDPECLA